MKFHVFKSFARVFIRGRLISRMRWKSMGTWHLHMKTRNSESGWYAPFRLIWEASENMYCDLKQCNFSTLFRACLHEGGWLQVGEVTCGGLPHLTCKRDHIKTRDYMERRVTQPRRVTSSTRGPPPSCKQALSVERFHSRGQNLCKFIETKESVYIRREFNSCRICLGH